MRSEGFGSASQSAVVRSLVLAGAAVAASGGELRAQATGNKVPDAQVESNVLKALAGSQKLVNQQISTTSVYGVVTLSGQVKDEETRTLAEDVVSRTAGVKKVVDELTIGDGLSSAPDAHAARSQSSGSEAASAGGPAGQLQSDGTYAPADSANEATAGDPAQAAGGQSPQNESQAAPGAPVQRSATGDQGNPAYGAGQTPYGQAPYGQQPSQAPYGQQGPPPRYGQAGEPPDAQEGQSTTDQQPGKSPYGDPGQAPGQNTYGRGGPVAPPASGQGSQAPSQGPYGASNQGSYGQQGPYGQPGSYGQGGPYRQPGNPAYGSPYGPSGAPVGQPGGRPVTVPTGSTLTIRLNQGLDSRNVQPGAPFSATVAQDVLAGGFVAIPRGALVHGTVVDVTTGGALKGHSTLTLQLTQVILGAQTYPIASNVWNADGRGKTERTVSNAVGLGALGAIIGAVAGGGVGAAVGAGAGAATGVGVSAASGGAPAFLPPESVIAFQLTNPAELTTVSQAEMQRMAYGVPNGSPGMVRRYPPPPPYYYGPGYPYAPRVYYRPYPY